MKAVLFDMDGVLIDSENYYMQGTYNWMKEKGFNGSFSQICRLIGTDMENTYKLIFDMFNGKYSIEEIKKMNTKYFLAHPINYKKIVKNGIYELLDFLKENNIKTAICSSSPKSYIEKVLIECDFLKYFDFIISADDVKKTKPNPEIYLKAIEFLKVSNEDCFIIEDSFLGIESGKRAKIKVIAIKDERFYQNQNNADYIFETFEEIKNFLRKKID